MVTTVLADMTDTGSLGLFVGIGYAALWIAPFVTILVMRRRWFFPVVFLWWYVWAGMTISCGATSVAFGRYNRDIAQLSGEGSVWNGDITYERARGKLAIDQIIEYPHRYLKVRARLPIPDQVELRTAGDFSVIISLVITGVWLAIPRVQLARLEKWVVVRLRPRARS